MEAALVYQQPKVVEAFVNIREGIPLAKEQLDIMGHLIHHFQINKKIHYLDLGCGDGYLGRWLLDTFPGSTGVLMDHSEPMLEIAKTKLSSSENYQGRRYEVIQADFSFPTWSNSLPKDGTDDEERASTSTLFDVVVSGFAIHHVSDERKRAIYHEVWDILKPGGLFLNLEHVSSPTLESEKIFEQMFCTSLFHAQKGQKSKQEIAQMVRHDLSVDEEANILSSVEAQCKWLRDIGYEHVDCYFKLFLIALFGGVKPK